MAAKKSQRRTRKKATSPSGAAQRTQASNQVAGDPPTTGESDERKTDPTAEESTTNPERPETEFDVSLAEGGVSAGPVTDTLEDPDEDDALLGGEDDEGDLAGAEPVGMQQTSLARMDPMQAYMREVQQHPLLTPEEEKDLATRYAESGDVAAAAQLVTSNLRLVVKIAYEYRRAYRNMMDLIQEGNMGLMQAVKKYDPYRGVKLSSYAAWWIRAYMLRYILANWRMVKLGTTQAQRKLFFNLSKEKARLSAMGIEASNVEIAKRLDVSETEVDEMDRRMSRGDASLDLPVNESDGRQIARVEMLPALGTTPELAAEGAELGLLMREHLGEFRETLKDKDLIIFDERLVADEPRTLQDLGDQFGVSRERVRQLEARITGRLRTFLSERLGDAVEIGA